MTKKYGGGPLGSFKVVKGKMFWAPPVDGGSRWSCYHHNPTIRAKGKTKGDNKKRSHDDSPWRASYSGGGFSSASVLDRLDYYPDRDEEDEDDGCGGYGSGYDGDHYADDVVAVGVGCGLHSSPAVEIRDVCGGGDEEEDDCMSFCEVGFVVDQIEESDWCLVEEM